MNSDLKQLIISVLIIFVLGMLFFMNQEKDNEVLVQRDKRLGRAKAETEESIDKDEPMVRP